MTSLDTVSAAERESLRLAWEAFLAGSVPVGAVLLDASGEIVATGRNRLYESGDAQPEFAGCFLAHAEVNALRRVEAGQALHSCTMVTSLEPCLLCVGALHACTVGRLVYLARDPHGGATSILGRGGLPAAKMVVDGPRRGESEMLSTALHVAFYLRFSGISSVVQAYECYDPGLLQQGRTVLQVYQMSHEAKATAPEVAFPRILDALSRLPKAAERGQPGTGPPPPMGR